MIRVENVGHSFDGERVLDGLSLEFTRGSSTVLIGRSGCGKTTILRLLAGLLKPDSGRLSVEGKGYEASGLSTGIILQTLGLFPWKTAEANIDLALETSGLAREQRLARVTETMTVLGVDGLRHKYPAELSGGQAQRVAIARTLIRQPELVLMDEPSASLDAFTREEFQDLVRGLRRQKNTTMIIVTHSIEEAAVLGERIIILRKAQPAVTIDNPLYGGHNPRAGEDFGPFCQKLRDALGAPTA